MHEKRKLAVMMEPPIGIEPMTYSLRVGHRAVPAGAAGCICPVSSGVLRFLERSCTRENCYQDCYQNRAPPLEGCAASLEAGSCLPLPLPMPCQRLAVKDAEGAE